MKILCLFPHQDDEVGLAPLIKEEISDGHSLFCVYLTDGSWNKNIPLVRNQESLAALTYLGIQKESIWFLGTDTNCRDGHLLDQLFSTYDILLQKLGPLNFQRIYCPSFEGGHQDHDAANLLAYRLAQSWNIENETWEFSLYNSFQIKKPFFRVLSLCYNGREYRKVQFSLLAGIKFSFLCRFYPSQWKTWVGLFPQSSFRFIFHRSIEIQKVKRMDLDAFNPGRPFLYEQRKRMNYEQFRQLAIPFLSNIV